MDECGDWLDLGRAGLPDRGTRRCANINADMKCLGANHSAGY